MLEMLDDLFKDSPDASQDKEADEIILIADRSGSMQMIQEDAQGGINSFIKEQQKEGNANITLVEFDDRIDAVYKQTDIKNVTEDYKLEPRGMTSLYDAVGMTLSNADNITTTGKKICVIVTDGGENSSQEWTQKSVFERIESLKEAGWDFLFLAANQDAMATGVGLGISGDETVTFAADSVGATSAYLATTNYVSNLRGGMSKSQTIDMLNTDISNLDGLGKSAVGDLIESEEDSDED